MKRLTPKQLMVLQRAMEWYALNIKAGCGRNNFSGQTRRLWNACVAAKKEADAARRLEKRNG